MLARSVIRGKPLLSLYRAFSLPTGISEGQYEELKKKISKRSDEGSVDLSFDGKIAILTLNNVHKKNAMTEKMMVDLANSVDELEKWKDGCGLILRGANSTFCSGFDLLSASRYTHNKEGKLELNLLMQTSLTRLRRLGLVSVCLIEGYAVGGGAELTTSTDFRVMKSGDKSYIRFIHNKLSLCPGWGGASRLTQIVGRKTALDVLLKAEKMYAPKAHSIGLVDDIIEGDALEGAKKFLEDYTQFNVNSTRAIKQLVANSELSIITPQLLAEERAIFAGVFSSPENINALENTDIVKRHSHSLVCFNTHT